MSLRPEQIDDLVNTTQQHLIKRGAKINYTTDLVDFVALREIFDKHKQVFNGGLDWRFDIMTDHNHSARMTGLFENDGATIVDSMVHGQVGPRFIDAHYVYDVREPEFQRGGLEIVNLIKTRYEAMKLSYLELLERALWAAPADATDTRTIYGIPFWITKSTTMGFNGVDPAGFATGRAGISSNTVSRWKNWTAGYDNVSKEDLIRTMRKAVRATNFRSPLSMNEPTFKSGNGIYTTDSVIGTMEEILEAQNMNLGNDLASKDNKTMFKSTPVTYVPLLDVDATNPIYLIDWKYMGLGMMAGWSERVTKPQQVPNKHTVRAVYLDSGVNMVCTDLRRQAVIVKKS